MVLYLTQTSLVKNKNRILLRTDQESSENTKHPMKLDSVQISKHQAPCEVFQVREFSTHQGFYVAWFDLEINNKKQVFSLCSVRSRIFSNNQSHCCGWRIVRSQQDRSRFAAQFGAVVKSMLRSSAHRSSANIKHSFVFSSDQGSSAYTEHPSS